MNEIMKEEQRSFEHKMDNIHQTNDLLDELEKKMNSYFHNNSSAKSTHQALLVQDQQEPPHSKFNQNFKIYDQKEQRMSQATVQNRPKKNDTFKLFGKARSKNETLNHTNQASIQPSLSYENKRRQSEQVFLDSPKIKNRKQSPFKNEKIQDEIKREESQKRSNHLVREMETMQLLMKEKMLGKERQIKQLEQQIITENQERVYLYKVNVRLEEELKFLQQSPQDNGHSEWQIRKMKDQAQRLKKELEKKKKQKKQLKRQEQTLKEGYKNIVQNRRDVTLKELERYNDREAQESYSVLKNLMDQLDRLKQVVESRIKSTGKSTRKRKVVKSFKA